MPEPTVIRRATADDLLPCHEVMFASVSDFGRRNGTPLEGTADDWWKGSEAYHRFLAEHAVEWWVAEDPESGGVFGFARTIEREGLLELTEFFVLPGRQSAGVGRQLIERAFPAGRGEVRSIIATTDVRALGRYYGSGTYPQFPFLSLAGTPFEAPVPRQLTAHEIDPESPDDLAAIREIEHSVLGFARGEAEVRWLLERRGGYRYLRDGSTVGFAFLRKEEHQGPIAAMEPGDLPGMLLHAETRAAELGLEKIELQVPGPNETAARHLLSRGFRIDPWVNLLMANRPFGQFDRLLPFGPPLFL